MPHREPVTWVPHEIEDQDPEYEGPDSEFEIDEESWPEIERLMLRSSPAYFASEVLTGSPDPPYNGRYFVAEHHEQWDSLIAEHNRLCVLAPRDHGKSYFFSFAYVIWRVWREQDGRGFIMSATERQAQRILEDIVGEVETNSKLRHLVPDTKSRKRWSSNYVRFANGHRLYAKGYGTKIRGFHPHYIVADDVVNDESAYSETIRKKQIDYWNSAVTNMILPDGQIIAVGTPLHRADLYGHLRENPEYHFQKYQAVDPEWTRSLWPERYSLLEDPPQGIASLPRRRREIGSIQFTREFMTDPVADDMSLFPGRLFRGDPVEQFQLRLGMPAEYWDELGVTRFMGIDLAISSNVGADYTVVWVMGLDSHGNRWIVDIHRERGMAYQDQLSLFNRVGRIYSPALVVIEENQMQRIFGDELIRTSDLPIKKFHTGTQKNALDKGIPSLRVLLENQKFRIPRGDKRSVELTDIWIDEMNSLTVEDGKIISVGEHDDTPMACWICDQGIRMGSFGFSFGEDVDLDGDLDSELFGEDSDPGIPENTVRPAGGNGGNGSGPDSEDLLRQQVRELTVRPSGVELEPEDPRRGSPELDPGQQLVDEADYFG